MTAGGMLCQLCTIASGGCCTVAIPSSFKRNSVVPYRLNRLQSFCRRRPLPLPPPPPSQVLLFSMFCHLSTSWCGFPIRHYRSLGSSSFSWKSQNSSSCSSDELLEFWSLTYPPRSSLGRRKAVISSQYQKNCDGGHTRVLHPHCGRKSRKFSLSSIPSDSGSPGPPPFPSFSITGSRGKDYRSSLSLTAANLLASLPSISSPTRNHRHFPLSTTTSSSASLPLRPSQSCSAARAGKDPLIISSPPPPPPPLREEEKDEGPNSNSKSNSCLPSSSSSAPPTATYVHLPFCRRRCFYCDFPILAVGERTQKTSAQVDSTMSNYVNLLCREIATTAKRFPPAAFGSGLDDPVVLHTVYFGGGTPSLLPVPLFRRVISELKTHFQFASDAEISMEMDPGTFDSQKLTGFLESGVTRVSLGVQSFQPELLQACGRAHGLQEVYDAVDAIKSSGLKNWSLDLMASLPNQTPQQWEHSLSEAVSLAPAHVSVYDLQIEEGTLFHRWFKAGEEPLPSDEKSAELYRTASRILREAGYEHYEVSNYAKPGFQSRHNLVYWENRPYYAFGLGSTSYIKGRRFSRPRKFKDYATYVDELDKDLVSRSVTESNIVAQSSTSLEDEVLDTVMLSLRLARGLDLMEFEAKFGSLLTSNLCTALVPFVEEGVVEVLDSQRQALQMGLYIQDWKDTNQNVDVVGGKGFSGGGANEGRGSVGGYEDTRLRKMEDFESLQQEWGSFKRRPGFVRLSDPDGFLISNEVISSIFAALPSVSGGGQ